MRVMVFTPYGPRLEPETVTAALGQEWDGDITHVIQCENPHGRYPRDNGQNFRTLEKRENILGQYQRGRELFLNGGYDAMLIIESDIIPPADALKKLDALQADWATGVYVMRHGNPVLNVTERYNYGGARTKNRGEPLRDDSLRAALKRGQTECSGGGIGCVLIRRHVIEAIPWRLGWTADCDHWFNNDVWDAGYLMMADMSVICGHKKPDGTILWPDYARISV